MASHARSVRAVLQSSSGYARANLDLERPLAVLSAGPGTPRASPVFGVGAGLGPPGICWTASAKQRSSGNRSASIITSPLSSHCPEELYPASFTSWCSPTSSPSEMSHLLSWILEQEGYVFPGKLEVTQSRGRGIFTECNVHGMNSRNFLSAGVTISGPTGLKQ
nr:zinc finger HIT domain-containing protein 3 isoform X2 [Globicephala melas]